MLKINLQFESAMTAKTKNSRNYSSFFKLISILLMAGIYLPLASAQEKLTVSAKDSRVSFAGEHVGMKFSGIFTEWNAELVLPPAKTPKIVATFDVASAKTGDSTYDSTLPEGDWFDVENHPKSVFESSHIVANGNDFDVTGTLTLRGITQPVSFLLKNDNTTLTTSFIIDRLAYNIGMDSDPDAEWVNKEIKMMLILQK